MSEGDCLKTLQTLSSSFSHFYRDFLFRVTPSIARIDSSNLNPQEFWNFGINFVALNYQTPGLMMDLQEGKFSANGGCGYILKPKIMWDDDYSAVNKTTLLPQVFI